MKIAEIAGTALAAFNALQECTHRVALARIASKTARAAKVQPLAPIAALDLFSNCVDCSTCWNPVSCINNRACPVIPNQTTSNSSNAGTIIVAVVVPIVSLIIIFAVVYKIVKKCT